MDFPEVLTRVKYAISNTRTLDEASKEKVYHILRQVFKDILRNEAPKKTKQELPRDKDMPEFLKNMFKL